MADDTSRTHEAPASSTPGAVDTEGLDGLFESLEQRIAAQERTAWGKLRARTARMSPRSRRMLLLPWVVGLPWIMLARPRPDLDAALHSPAVVLMLYCAGLAVAFGVRALRGWQVAAPSRAVSACWMIATATGLGVLLTLAGGEVSLAVTAGGAGATWLHVMPCLVAGLGLGLPVYGLARVLGRGSPHSGLFAAATGGLSANLALALHCGIGDPAHLLPAHGGVWLMLVAMAWAVGTWRGVRRWRASG